MYFPGLHIPAAGPAVPVCGTMPFSVFLS